MTKTKHSETTKQVQRTGIAIGLLVVLYLLMHLLTGGRFFTVSNMLSVLTSSVVTAFVVMGFCFIFTMGIMDLSMGAVMILASNVGGILAVNVGLGYVGLVLGSVITAAALMMLNLILMRVTKIPPWIFGLGMTMVYEAIGAIYNSAQIAQGRQAVSLGDTCRGLGVPPANIIVLVAGVVAAYFIFNRTAVGFSLRAVGSNAPVAKMMGIDINKAILMAGLVASLFIGLASAINLSYSGRINPTTGLNSITTIFIPLAAFLLATALEKVFNITVGAAIAAFLVTSIFNVLTLFGVPSGTWQQVVMGGCVLACGVVSQRKYKGVVK